MFNFQQLVESVLLESQQDFLTAYQGKIPGLNLAVLTAVYDLLSPKGYNYVAAKVWEPYTDFTPVLNVITMALGGTYKDARDKIKNAPITTADEFYTYIKTLIVPPIDALIKPIDRYTPTDTIVPDVRDTHSRALRLKSSNVLQQNVWPSIENLTVVDAISTILKNRLTGLENLKMKFVIPLKKISEIATGSNYDNVMLDVFKNFEAYSKGSKKYSKDIVEILKSIDVVPEDFVKVATHTRNLYSDLLNNEYSTLPDDERDNNINASFIHENIWEFAKTGTFTYILNNKKEISTNKYTLKFIQALSTGNSKLLIDQIKSMSAGVRYKDQSFQQLISKTAGALGALRVGMGPVG